MRYTDTFLGYVGHNALDAFALLMGLLVLAPVVLVLAMPFIV